MKHCLGLWVLPFSGALSLTGWEEQGKPKAAEFEYLSSSRGSQVLLGPVLYHFSYWVGAPNLLEGDHSQHCCRVVSLLHLSTQGTYRNTHIVTYMGTSILYAERYTHIHMCIANIYSAQPHVYMCRAIHVVYMFIFICTCERCTCCD